MNETNAVAVSSNADLVANLVLSGDLSKMSDVQKVQYYQQYCERIGLDPLTQPFLILKLNGKETLYASKNCTSQLNQLHSLSHEILNTERVMDVLTVTVRCTGKDGRFTDEVGSVSIMNLSGDNLANAIMKASTKAKRRATLVHCGLGMLDETELETIKGAASAPIEPKITNLIEKVKGNILKDKPLEERILDMYKEAIKRIQSVDSFTPKQQSTLAYGIIEKITGKHVNSKASLLTLTEEDLTAIQAIGASDPDYIDKQVRGE